LRSSASTRKRTSRAALWPWSMAGKARRKRSTTMNGARARKTEARVGDTLWKRPTCSRASTPAKPPNFGSCGWTSRNLKPAVFREKITLQICGNTRRRSFERARFLSRAVNPSERRKARLEPRASKTGSADGRRFPRAGHTAPSPSAGTMCRLCHRKTNAFRFSMATS